MILFVVSYMRHKNINYEKFFYSNLQLPAYTAYGSQQKITNLMVRHLNKPYFLESCGSDMLLWRCYIIKEASRFRNKVAKIILAKKNIETFNTLIGYAISFKVIFQNCSQKKGFTICLCDSWSLLDFCHFLLILLSKLWNHVQSQLQKNKIRFGGSFRGRKAVGSVGASSFGWFLGGFGWVILLEDNFGWFQVVYCFSSYTDFTAYRRVNC